MARPARSERSRSARPSRQLSRFYHSINPDRVFGTHNYEFDRPTMETRWAQGLSDAQETIMAAPWLEPMPPELGARTFDVRAKGPIGDASKNSLNNKAGG